MLVASAAVTLLSVSACKTTRRASDLASTDVSLDQAYCNALGLVAKPFTAGTGKSDLGAIASDFAVPTNHGDFHLAEVYSGCDTYLMVQDLPRQHQEHKTSPWLSDMPELLKALPRNTHVLFASSMSDPKVANLSLQVLEQTIGQALAPMSEADQAHWRSHLHIVTVPIAAMPGWIGEAMRSPGWGVGIDRFQRIRYVGSYSDPTRFVAALDDFGPNLAMLANEPIYYNFEAKREAQLESENATVVPVFTAQPIDDDHGQKYGYAEVTLPDAETMATYDTMEIDLLQGCPGVGELGNCPAWDSTLSLKLCDQQNPDQCETEIGRWISTYHRIGRWVHDVSPVLPLFKAGGKFRFAFYTDQTYQITLSLRLANRGSGMHPVQTSFLFKGGNFDASYNKDRKPLSLKIPATAKKVELVSVITGHGMQEPGNCAEFCDTTHRFLVNGKAFERTFSEASSELGCMKKVDSGTVPNQFGTWWYGRSGWCPGRHVEMHRQDITAAVRAGGDNEFQYEGLYKGEPYPVSGAAIMMSSAVVVYE